MGDFNIKVTIGNRVYPLTIDPQEEERVRKAANMINEIVKEYEQQYAVKDKQDLLAMVALRFANEILDEKAGKVMADEEVVADLEAINRQLAEQL